MTSSTSNWEKLEGLIIELRDDPALRAIFQTGKTTEKLFELSQRGLQIDNIAEMYEDIQMMTKAGVELDFWTW